MKKRCIIVIPVYKAEPDTQEKASLLQCARILGEYPICFVHPEGLDLAPYKSCCPGATSTGFSPRYFKSPETYNFLMLNPAFYRAFDAYEYMLVYQTDAWVFRNELEYWCAQGYDYIGAPVHNFRLSNYHAPISVATLNGGFSLRKIDGMIRVLTRFRFIYRFADLLKTNTAASGRWVGTLKAVWFYFTGNNSYYRFNKYDRNEDFFFAILAPAWHSNYKTAPVDRAAAFSADNEPEKTLHMNGGNLPFGAHAVNKYSDFWKTHLPFL